jgi:CheY-like chemotaxis protein
MQQQCVLIIDDDEEDCDFLKECLIDVGVTLPIVVAHDGPAAFKFLEDLNGYLPKLIVLDVNMPLMNGLTFYSKLRLTSNIPVIFYTTSCDDDLVKQARDLGAIDCVKKGVTYVDSMGFAKRVAEFVKIVA